MIKLKKYPIPKAANSLNQDNQQFSKISEILQSVQIMTGDTKSNTFSPGIYIA